MFFLLTLLHPGAIIQSLRLSLGGLPPAVDYNPVYSILCTNSPLDAKYSTVFDLKCCQARQVFVQESLEVGLLLSYSSCTGFI